MGYHWRYKNKVYGVAQTPPPPTRGDIFIGSRAAGQRLLWRLPSVSMCCFDLEKIEFSLYYPAEDYINAPNDQFENRYNEHATSPETFCEGDFKHLLIRQMIHQDFGIRGIDCLVTRPSHVFYTRTIDDTKSPSGCTVVGECITYLTASRAISATNLEEHFN